ncbi:hypothetical protein BMR08_09240 [Methylococcaceae bacterium CS2]|uniref:hypothetical protein n=1 Tax=Bathymodiolus platifrons methanotrophic gill symbiont TaxID=113268 RepID=UPI000B42335A|nr:hypothetical protein [Bathymodiolus platifrons methanotrophic gill symbiont]TXL01089.1 hypothetical protein BMR09_17895 [Methylococcaceae bacterium CS3]TXL10364.1 hypothetical protein BMR08_09240 [Methylococcaceae bacterium CS2]
MEGDYLYEWGGALRWLKSDLDLQSIRSEPNLSGGHATLFRSLGERNDIFHPLPTPLLKLHQRLKLAFDPHGLFNIGRMYADF